MSPEAPRVLIAPDKFKGSLTGPEVAEALADGLREALPGARVVLRPVADGGDGTAAAAVAAGWTWVPHTVSGPFPGGTRRSGYARLGDRALVELADVCGLVVAAGRPPAPLDTTTTGVGDLLRLALDAGCTDLTVGLGGSASTDGGLGMLHALGAVARDARGLPLPPTGRHLGAVASLDLTGLDPRVRAARFTMATDVTSPLYGPRGAAFAFAPQKGATPRETERLDAGLRNLARVLTQTAGADPAHRPGSGAAGGVAASARAVLRADVVPGADYVFALLDLDTALRGSTVVITGEGCLDRQTLDGKAPARVAERAAALGVETLAVAGTVRLSAAELARAGFRAHYALTDLEPDITECLRVPRPLLRRTGHRIGETLGARQG